MISHIRLRRGLPIFASSFLFAMIASVMAAQPDGPYILRGGNGGWEAVSVEVTAEGAARKSRPLAADAAVMIPAVGQAPAFQVKLRAAAPEAPGEIKTAANAPLFVVADTHGEYETLVTTLLAHKVIDAQMRWKFARGQLVVLGDVFDRGPNHLEILWLLYKLEPEAAKAGGGVQLLLGNHETMVLRGDLRYLHGKYVDTAQVLQQPAYSGLFARETLLGQWLRSKPAMQKVNDLLFLHAGVSRALVDSGLSLTDVNATVRSVLNGEDEGAIAELVMGSFGPLWYRGHFAEPGKAPLATAQDVDLALKIYGAKRMLVGHTIVPAITSLYQGKVIAVQSRPFEALLIRKGELWLAAIDGGLKRLPIDPD